MISSALMVDFFFQNFSFVGKEVSENTHRLLHQYSPEKTSFVNISDQDIKRVEDILNNRPRENWISSEYNLFFNGLMEPTCLIYSVVRVCVFNRCGLLNIK